jgi:hypothetical protein
MNLLAAHVELLADVDLIDPIALVGKPAVHRIVLNSYQLFVRHCLEAMHGAEDRDEALRLRAAWFLAFDVEG